MTRLFTCGVLLVACGVVAQAHHSIAGMYDAGRRVTVEGTVAQFHFVNPHPFVLLDVTDAGGKPRQWRLEMDNRRELVDIGVKEDTLRYGDRLVASGSPGRSEQRVMYAWKIERPADGLVYEQVGASPSIRIPSR